jgi:branched-subunit amino acid aminotransferase/4-amino-4-deoxychorismate lyase
MATILGPPRDIPIAKDTNWVSDREYLESMRPDGACECLLSTQEGCVLEGMITNFYVIRKMHRLNSEEFEFVLQTASVEEGVVWGTLRWRVLQACQCLGIRVIEQAPSMHERHTWKEAFLTNSLRGVQPLTKIVCDARSVWGLPSWELELPVDEASITEKLLECIDALMERSLVDIRQLLASL